MSNIDLQLEISWVRFGGFRTRQIERKGPADRTLLFIHGWADSADTWKPLMAALADVPARRVAIDLPQFGGADDLLPGPQLPQFVAFVRAALDFYGAAGTLVPVAQSLGGRALLMALNGRRNENVPACVVIGPAPLELPAWQKMLVRNASLASSASKLGEGLSWDQQQAEFLRSFKRTCLAHPERVAESVYVDYLSHYTVERVGRHIESLRSIGDELQQPLNLAALDLPVEIIWGELDRMAPIKGTQLYLQAIPKVNLSVLPDCGHHAHLECVAETTAIIRRTLALAGLL